MNFDNYLNYYLIVMRIILLLILQVSGDECICCYGIDDFLELFCMVYQEIYCGEDVNCLILFNVGISYECVQ